MNETQVTLTGWLGNDVTTRQAGGATVASFRLACTPRRFHRAREEWVDGETQWYTVNAWRALGDNCADSLRRGDPVVVHGRLTTSRWVNTAGVEVTGSEVEAAFVGHDLNRGSSRFRRTPRPDAQVPASDGTDDDPAGLPGVVAVEAAITGRVEGGDVETPEEVAAA